MQWQDLLFQSQNYQRSRTVVFSIVSLLLGKEDWSLSSEIHVARAPPLLLILLQQYWFPLSCHLLRIYRALPLVSTEPPRSQLQIYPADESLQDRSDFRALQLPGNCREVSPSRLDARSYLPRAQSIAPSFRQPVVHTTRGSALAASGTCRHPGSATPRAQVRKPRLPHSADPAPVRAGSPAGRRPPPRLGSDLPASRASGPASGEPRPESGPSRSTGRASGTPIDRPASRRTRRRLESHPQCDASTSDRQGKPWPNVG